MNSQNMAETESRTEAELRNLGSTYRYIGVFRTAKIIIIWNYFPMTIQYVWQGSKYHQTFEYFGVLNIPGIENILEMCEYALE